MVCYNTIQYFFSCFKWQANKIANGNVNKWLQDSVQVRQSYIENYVFNIDETGDIIICSLDFKGMKSHGCAKSKERLTFVLCCNATAQKNTRFEF